MVPQPHIPEENLLGLQVGEVVSLNCAVSVETGVQFRMDWELPDGRKLDDRIEALPAVKLAGQSGRYFYERIQILSKSSSGTPAMRNILAVLRVVNSDITGQLNFRNLNWFPRKLSSLPLVNQTNGI